MASTVVGIGVAQNPACLSHRWITVGSRGTLLPRPIQCWLRPCQCSPECQLKKGNISAPMSIISALQQFVLIGDTLPKQQSTHLLKSKFSLPDMLNVVLSFLLNLFFLAQSDGEALPSSAPSTTSLKKQCLSLQVVVRKYLALAVGRREPE